MVWSVQKHNRIDAKVMSDDVRLKYLKILISGSAKNATNEFAYSGKFYKAALKTLERNIGQPQTVVSAHLEKLAIFSHLKLYCLESVFSFASCISSFSALLKSLGYEYYLKSTSVLNQFFFKVPFEYERFVVSSRCKDMLETANRFR